MGNTEMDEFVERVRERSDIYSVVSRYVPMTSKGGRYWACCPFHGEKTASFTITPDKGLFYCFGCHAGGNVFNFISMIENISYFEAVKLQAERLGIPLPSQKKSQAELEKEREEEILFKINGLARDFYHSFLLKRAEGEVGRKYLNARGITGGTIEGFKLGLAPYSWDRLRQEFLKRGFTDEQLVAAGLVSKQRNGDKFFDRMRGRVIIPITDIFGHVVGFGGRILDSFAQKDSPKYLNTPETMIFNKGKLLFGLDKANRSIFEKKFVVVVEGYMDAISLASAGFKNVVATLGTAFTEEHAKLLLRHTRKIVFCYDSDEAGQRATFRALPIVEKTGADISVIKIPDGKDPDEFIRKHGLNEFELLAKNSMSLFDYRLQYVLNQTEHESLDGKINALKKVLPFVASVHDSPKSHEYCKKLSLILMLDESTVLSELKKFSSAPVHFPTSRNSKVQEKKTEVQVVQQAGEFILRMLWHECDLYGYVTSLIKKDSFTKIHAEIFDYFRQCYEKDERPTDVSAGKILSVEANTELSRILSSGSPDPLTDEKNIFNESIMAIKRVCLKRIYEEKVKEANEYLSSDFSVYLEKIQKTLEIRKQLDYFK